MRRIVLTRELILSGKYLQSFEGVPTEIRWTPEQIAQSLHDTMLARPSGGELWLFAYGSLIWNPLFEVDERRVATIPGWQRSFCLRTVAGRASSATPGRMLSLVPGASTAGIALRLSSERIDEDLRVIWIREMVNGAYIPTWAPITLDDGTAKTALVFVANPDNALHADHADISEVAPFIAAATGPLGTNADYVKLLRSALHDREISDPYIEQLAKELEHIAEHRLTEPR
jgi:glutathione-specific gamma-glutamylcyclotransferase